MTLSVHEVLERIDNPELARQARGLLENFGDRPIEVHEGDLEASGPWSPPASPYVITGDLRVAGSVITSAENRDGGLLIVLGGIYCQDLLAAEESTTLCGRVEVPGLLFAATRDVIFEVFGPMKVHYLISGAGTGWLSSYHDDVSLSGYHDYFTDGRTGEAHAAGETQHHVDLRHLVVEDVLDFEEWECMSDDERAAETADGQSRYDYAGFDEHEVHRRFYAGQPILA